MPETGKFVTLWEDSLGERWRGYFEPPQVCWAKDNKKGGTRAVTAAPDLQKQIDQLNAQQPDVNKDGLPDRFVLVEEAVGIYRLSVLRGARTETSLGCAGHYTLTRETGFEKAPQTLKTFSFKPQQLKWNPDDLTLVVSGVDVFAGRAQEVKWIFTVRPCPPPAVFSNEQYGDCGL